MKKLLLLTLLTEAQPYSVRTVKEAKQNKHKNTREMTKLLTPKKHKEVMESKCRIELRTTMEPSVIEYVRCANIEACMWMIGHIVSWVYLCSPRCSTLSLPQRHHNAWVSGSTRDDEWITLTNRYYHWRRRLWMRCKEVIFICTCNQLFNCTYLINRNHIFRFTLNSRCDLLHGKSTSL